MKKIIPVLSVLFALSAVNVFAQDATENINVSANVQSAINVNTIVNLITFGQVQSGQQAIISADPNGTDENAETPQRAEIVIEGAVNEAFQITFNNAILSNGTNTVDFATDLFVVSGSESSNGAISSGDQISADGSGDNIVLSIGGTLDAISAANAGTYSTTQTGGESITVEFNYTSI
ncbi:MAG: hypothetical protein JJU46_09345 [Balneolaceae bacterium]|nr:hypothetical protein [Balneolaceae bacterium]MCH8548667.1 hypothetical protein [Balneolaceae bacterium]